MKTYRTRKAAAENVKAQLTHNTINRRDVPSQLFIITNYRPGKRPVWTVQETSPGAQDRFYGPFRQGNVQALTERLGVEWYTPVLPAWIGRPLSNDRLGRG